MNLPKANRLRQRRDFNAVYQAGIRRNTKHLTLRALQRAAKQRMSEITDLAELKDQPTCIGISISQKVSKKAVVRNRIRRQIKAALRQLLPYLSPGWRIVIIVKPDAIQCGYEQFLQELKQLLISAEVIDGY